MALLSQFSMLLLLAVGASLGQCPPSEDTLPCSCIVCDIRDNCNIKVLCSRVNNLDDVRKAIQSVKGIRRVFVEVDNSQLGSVPSDLFKGLHVTRLFYYNCVLERIGDVGRSALEGLEDVVEDFLVQYSFSKDNGMKSLNVSRLRALENLDIRDNHIKKVGNEWFSEGPANLKVLYMSWNEMTSLGYRAFAQLTNIQELWIGYSEIETVQRSMFPSPALHLEAIHMNDNKITSIPVDLFSDMPKLKTVSLIDNSIQRIPEDTWKPVWSRLRELYLIGNPLNCDANIDWIIQVPRPFLLNGECVSPKERKGLDLVKLIDGE